MAEAAVSFMLEQLKEVAIGYKDLISGAADDFEGLNDDLARLKAHLKEMAKGSQDEPSRLLQRRIRDAVYEVEDTIDTCLTDAIKSSHKLISFTNVNLAKKVKLIRNKVTPLIDEAQKLGVRSGGVQNLHSEATREIPIRQNKVVGFDGEEATIIGYLEETTSSLDVISIVGIPGQGKTTLAWKIYQNDVIDFQFPIRIWVYISQTFNTRDVFLQILRKFIPSQDTNNLNDDELAQTVRKCLEKEKFLLVLDDVWSVDAWDKIKEVLPEENVEGKILITSRDKGVGKKACVHRDPHTLRFLDEDESWTLLQYEVFGNLESCPKHLSGTGYHIAIKCDGVPLTIVVIGGILSDQLNKSPSKALTEWETVASNVSGTMQEGEEAAKRITDVVALSYNRLPDDLRECFVFLGVFPEDYAIPAKMLCGLWISEGFILPKKGKSVEESAEDNLNDLISRNLLKVEAANHMGKVKTCRVHDIIRAFCIAKSEEENLFQEIKKSRAGTFEPPLTAVKKSHRLCFRSDLSKFLSDTPSGPHVRSFMCFYEQPFKLEPQHISVIPDNFRKLRILESKCIKFDQFPAKITKLIHLRYLTLYIETLKTLPDAITLLWNLQSLVVETKSNTVEMKANMWKMVRLRYLKTKAAIVLDNKLEGKAGENLHTLNRLSPESCTDYVAERAKNLKTLGISGKLANFFNKDFLQKLHHLEKLKLVNSLTYEQTSEDKLHTIPKYNGFPPYLKRLTLTNTFIGWQHMSALASIKTLEALKLKDNAFVGVSWNVSGYNFPDLQLLLIVNTDLVLWEVSADSFPKLKFLVVKTCENLKEIPECLGTDLEKLEIERLRPSAVQSAQKIAETKKLKSKNKYAAQFNLIIGAACMTR